MRIHVLLLTVLYGVLFQTTYADDAHTSPAANAETSSSSCAHEERQTQELLRLGILDFSCAGETKLADWLGVAMAEALYTRLAGVPGVMLLERQRVAVLTAHANQRQLQGLGCDVLVTGTVQALPAGATTRLRVNIKLISASTALLHGTESLVIDGELPELFTLQRLAAGELAHALTLRAANAELARPNGSNLAAEELFAHGTGQLMHAVRTAVSAQHEKETEETRILLRRAIDLLRRAQQANNGYFVRAHTLETDARELLARLTPEEAATIRADTVSVLQNDAGAAAPAFFNLGRALQANGDYAAAISAYTDFLSWMDARQRLLAWRTGPETDFYVSHAHHWHERQITCCPATTTITVYGGVCVAAGWLDREIKDGAIFGIDVNDGRTLWSVPFPRKDEKQYHRLLFDKLAVYFASSDGEIMAINPADGTVFAHVQLPVYTPATPEYSRAQIGVCDDVGRTLIIRRMFRARRDNAFRFVEELHALAPDSLQTLWSRKYSGECANAFWLLDGKVILQQKSEGQNIYRQLAAASGEAAANPLPEELLAILGFSHSDVSEIFTCADGTRYLVTAQEKEATSAELYRIATDWRSFEASEDFDGAFMRNWQSSSIVPYTREKSQGALRLLCRNPADDVAQAIGIPQNLAAQIASKKMDFSVNYAYNPPYLTAVRDGSAYEVYRLHDNEISLHWRHSFTAWGNGGGWGTSAPQAANEAIIGHRFNNIQRGGTITRYNIPATAEQLSDAQALLHIGQCHASLGQNDKARDFLAQAIERDLKLAEAHYRMASLLLHEGETIDAWRHAESFARFTHRDDPRREELWREIVRANRILWRGNDSYCSGTRIIDSTRSIAYFDSGRLHISQLASGSAAYTEEGELFPADTAILSERDGIITVHAADYENVSRTRVFRYDTTARKVVATVDYPNTRHVRREGWVHDHAMRQLYDQRPALLHDEGRPETFLLVDVANPQKHRRVRLKNAISPYLTTDHRFKSYRENALGFCFEVPVSGIIYNDMVVIAGFAAEDNRHAYVIAGYSRKDDRVIWEHLLPMSAQARHRINSHYRRLHLLPLGNRFLLHAYKDSQWHIFDLRTGFLNSQRMPGDTAWPFALPALAGHALLFDENAYIDPALYASAVEEDYADLGGTLTPQGLLLRHNLSQGQRYALFDPQTRQPIYEGRWCFPRALYVHPDFVLGHIHINPDDAYSVIFSAQTLLPHALRMPESRPLLIDHEDYIPRFSSPSANAPAATGEPEDGK